MPFKQQAASGSAGNAWRVVEFGFLLPPQPLRILITFATNESAWQMNSYVMLGRSIRCPEGYTSADEHEDLVRRDELFDKWRRQPSLTREDDAEEAHLFARIARFKVECNRARNSIDVLRKLGDKRSAIEQSELDALESRFRRIPPQNGLFWLVDY
jgi:hypothetical protein